MRVLVSTCFCHMCVCVLICASVKARGCLSLSLLTLFFETRSPMNLELAVWAKPLPSDSLTLSARSSLSPPCLQCWGLRYVSSTCLGWCGDLNSGSYAFTESSFPLSHLSSPRLRSLSEQLFCLCKGCLRDLWSTISEYMKQLQFFWLLYHDLDQTFIGSKWYILSWDCRDGSVRKSLAAPPEDLSFVPSTCIECNSSSKIPMPSSDLTDKSKDKILKQWPV